MWKGEHVSTVNLMMCINLVQAVCTDCCTQEAYVPYMKKTSKVCNSCYEHLRIRKLTIMHQSPYTATNSCYRKYLEHTKCFLNNLPPAKHTGDTLIYPNYVHQ